MTRAFIFSDWANRVTGSEYLPQWRRQLRDNASEDLASMRVTYRRGRAYFAPTAKPKSTWGGRFSFCRVFSNALRMLRGFGEYAGENQ